jgi:hypothetical protein
MRWKSRSRPTEIRTPGIEIPPGWSTKIRCDVSIGRAHFRKVWSVGHCSNKTVNIACREPRQEGPNTHIRFAKTDTSSESIYSGTSQLQNKGSQHERENTHENEKPKGCPRISRRCGVGLTKRCTYPSLYALTRHTRP